MTAMEETTREHREPEAGTPVEGRTPRLSELVAGILQAHLRHHPEASRDLPTLIADIGDALRPYHDPEWRPGSGAPPTRNAAASRLIDAASATRAPVPDAASADEKPSWMPDGTFGPQRPPWAPAVDPARSHTYAHVICLEDGREMQMLKRHLKKTYGMTPEQYVRKWGLPEDYPLSSEKYRMERRQIAGAMGFQSGRAPAPKNRRRRPSPNGAA